jgi:hypothetical protein
MQGEPLLNLPSVVKAYHLLNQQIGIGGRFITVSTVGEANVPIRCSPYYPSIIRSLYPGPHVLILMEKGRG